MKLLINAETYKKDNKINNLAIFFTPSKSDENPNDSMASNEKFTSKNEFNLMKSILPTAIAVFIIFSPILSTLLFSQ